MTTTDNRTGSAASPLGQGATGPAGPAAAAPDAMTSAATKRSMGGSGPGPSGHGGPSAPAGAPGTRRKALAIIAGLVLLAGAGYGAYWALVLNHVESTDNAYVQGNVVQITPQVAGTVVAIQADDNDRVTAGQPLLRLDAADARLALTQAEAQLAQTVREVRSVFSTNSTLGAQVALREAEAARARSDTARAQNEVARAQAEVTRLQDDVNRRAPLVASGAVGKEEFAHAQAQLTTARSTLAAAQSAAGAAANGAGAAGSAIVAAREQLGSNRNLTDGLSIAQHPAVQRAAGHLREAFLASRRTELPAPTDGVIARRNVQIGQRVAAGAPLMTLVALDKLWVDANFKEGQLRKLRIGQPATLMADVYGKQVAFHGKVSGLGAGTGSTFALLPAQNATGNWIKVVQRVPVRITLDPQELVAHPLRLGLSMTVDVDVADQTGPMLASTPRQQPVAETAVFDSLNRQADDAVLRIVRANLPAGASVDLSPLLGAPSAAGAAPVDGAANPAAAEPAQPTHPAAADKAHPAAAGQAQPAAAGQAHPAAVRSSAPRGASHRTPRTVAAVPADARSADAPVAQARPAAAAPGAVQRAATRPAEANLADFQWAAATPSARQAR